MRGPFVQDKTINATRFFEAHPVRWLPAFIDRIREHPDALLFRVVADVLDATFDIEKRFARKFDKTGAFPPTVFFLRQIR